jgi:hypothetical protein
VYHAYHPCARGRATSRYPHIFARKTIRAQREEEMRPYRDAAAQLSSTHPGGTIELETGEDPRTVMMRMHRATRDAGKFIRFSRSQRSGNELRFRLQTEEETTRLKERGQRLAQARQAKGGKAANDRAEAEC